MAKDSKDYQPDAFDVERDKGPLVHSLSELFSYILNLLDRIKQDYIAKRENPLHLPSDKMALSLGERITQGPYTWWFRGVSTDHYDLESRIFRGNLQELKFPNKVIDYADLDRRLRHEYFGETRRHFAEAERNIWDQVFEMQHYGMPTRLLDWSLSFITAAFFAIEDGQKEKNAKEGHPTVWILNPRVLSGVCLGEYAVNDYPYLEIHGKEPELNQWNKIKIDFLDVRSLFGKSNWLYHALINSEGHFPVLSSWTNPRLLAQAGCFTLQGGDEKYSIQKLAAACKARGEPRFLFKVRLNRDNLDEFKNDLNLLGISRRFYFPEIDQVADVIKKNRNL